jgi:hypothetical protein
MNSLFASIDCRTFFVPTAACCATLLSAGSAAAQSDSIPYAPYGMDPVPYAVFYRGAWDRYGSDPTPQSTTSDLGFTDVYGLDPIPTGAVPRLQELRHTLPQQTLEVLTQAIEEFDPGQSHPMWDAHPGHGVDAPIGPNRNRSR